MNVQENRLTNEQLHRIAKALADPQRFAILQRIACHPEVACKQLVSEFSITQATISHHLKELVAADLIHCRRVGQCAMLSRREDILIDYLDHLNRRLLPPLADLTAENQSATDAIPPQCLMDKA
ncbi:MAG TPA: ArsR family transcriptional regulator [Planctomycetaceae bacterium]|nr:ArsR family transcriptional regulator [Planctomycetaceae bacterium]